MNGKGGGRGHDANLRVGQTKPKIGTPTGDCAIPATAAAFAEPTLRGLDAFHLATAHVFTNEAGAGLLAFVTYDRCLLDAAKAAGLTLVRSIETSGGVEHFVLRFFPWSASVSET